MDRLDLPADSAAEPLVERSIHRSQDASRFEEVLRKVTLDNVLELEASSRHRCVGVVLMLLS